MRTTKADVRRSAAILVGVLTLASLSLPAAGVTPADGPRAASASRSLSPAAQSLPSTTIFAADCATPKTTFNLGDTVCAQVTGLIGLRLQWVDPDGFAVITTDVTADPQTDTFALPSGDQSSIGGLFIANNLGNWRIIGVTPFATVNQTSFFTVRDPANPRADLSIVKTLAAAQIPVAGSTFQYLVRIGNQGPDAAANVHLVDNTFTNSIFNSIAQNDGPAFTCSGSGVDCTIASFPNGAVATFTLTFTAGSAGGVIANTATVSSDTTDLNPTDNSFDAPPVVAAGTGTPPTCDIVVNAPPSVTLFTGPSATSCAVTVTDLDATLGTGSATDTCELVGGVTRGGVPVGNVFPVGTTIVSYSATDVFENSASAIQVVNVVDNTPPVITCPPSITLEPTCPQGAVASWTVPVATDNCPGVTTVQSTGLADGSVFPIGTTTVTYTATDAGGNQASCNFTVTVLTVAATIQNLETSINGTTLSGPQKQGLIPKLDAVLEAFNRRNIHAACGPLNAFVTAVQGLITDGSITAAQGQAWINTAAHIGNTIGCTNNPCS